MRKILLLFLAITQIGNIWSEVHAQTNNGNISGVVKDKKGTLIEQVKIEIVDTDFVTYTDDNGKFTIENLSQGDFKIIASYVGLESNTQYVTVKSGKTTTVFIELSDQLNILTEVTVIGRIGVTQVEPQKVRYATKDLPSQNGGTAGDMLKNMLSVAMGGSPNHNRDIRYRGLGNGYTTVLINGSSSGITGNNRETVLDMIPVSQIDYIEIISNPTADQNANGINGIVNIVLKRVKSAEKNNGQISFYADNHEGSNGNFSIQYNNEELSVLGSFDKLKRNANKFDKGYQTKFNTDGSLKETVSIEKSEIKTFENNTASGRIEYLTKNNLSFVGEYLFGEQAENKEKEELNITNKSDNTFKSGKKRFENEDKLTQFYNPSIIITKSWKNSSFELNLNSNISNEDKEKLFKEYNTKPDAVVDYTKLPTQQAEKEKIQFNNYFPSFALKTNVGSNVTIKTGFQGFFTNRYATKETKKLNNITNEWGIVPNNTNQFDLVENTFASYVASNWDLNKFKLNLGYRYEFTSLKSKSINNTTVNKSSEYQIALPNFSLTYSFTDKSYLKSSIGRRIRRPAFNDMNPTVEIKSATEIKVGNPDLKPEKAWAYELGYFREVRNINYGVNVFHRNINDIIQKNFTTDNLGVTTEGFINLNRAISSGVEFLVGVTPVKWYDLNLNYSRFWSEIKDNSNFNGDAIKDQTDWTFKTIHNFNFPKGFDIQFTTNFVGPKISNQETEKIIWFTDLGIEKQLFTNGYFSVRVIDVFDTLKKQKTKNTLVQFEEMTENTPGSIVSAGFRWQF